MNLSKVTEIVITFCRERKIPYKDVTEYDMIGEPTEPTLKVLGVDVSLHLYETKEDIVNDLEEIATLHGKGK